jgi:DHA1 family bicyclomycin/chloramphenicol resistance-like MFS transporter
MPALMVVFGVNLWTLMAPLGVLMASSGFMGPVALAGAVSHRPDIAGTGSGLSSSLGLLLTAVFAALAGSLYDGNALTIGLLIAFTTVAAVGSLMLALRPTPLIHEERHG